MNSEVQPCAAVILAAGASTRMGSAKALLRIGDETFLDHLIDLFSSFCDPVITVVGHHSAEIRERIIRTGQTRFAANPVPENGMLSSLQVGLAEVPGSCRSVFFHPCDMPGIQPATLGLLLDALARASGDSLAAVPVFDGRRGHPALIRAEWIPAFLAVPLTSSARELLEAEPGAVLEVPMLDAAVRRDFDTPGEYEAVFGAGR